MGAWHLSFADVCGWGLSHGLHAVVAVYLSALQRAELALYELLAQGGDAVGEDFAFEVVHLVLQYACEVSVYPLVVLLELLVHPCHAYALGALYGLVYAGQAEASLLEGLGLGVVELEDVGVDVCAVEAGVLGEVLLQGVERYDDEAYGLADLRSREAYSVALVHGLEHVGDELLEVVDR